MKADFIARRSGGRAQTSRNPPDYAMAGARSGRARCLSFGGYPLCLHSPSSRNSRPWLSELSDFVPCRGNRCVRPSTSSPPSSTALSAVDRPHVSHGAEGRVLWASRKFGWFPYGCPASCWRLSSILSEIVSINRSSVCLTASVVLPTKSQVALPI